jgi:hypothetical protein
MSRIWDHLTRVLGRSERPHKPRLGRKNRLFLAVEHLEAREVPSTTVWLNGPNLEIDSNDPHVSIILDHNNKTSTTLVNINGGQATYSFSDKQILSILPKLNTSSCDLSILATAHQILLQGGGTIQCKMGNNQDGMADIGEDVDFANCTLNLALDDSHDKMPLWTGVTVHSGAVTGLCLGQITFNNATVDGVTLDLGHGQEHVTVDESTQKGTPGPVVINDLSGDGPKSFDVQATQASLHIYIGAKSLAPGAKNVGSDTVNIGGGGSLGGIAMSLALLRGPVTLESGGGDAVLSIDTGIHGGMNKIPLTSTLDDTGLDWGGSVHWDANMIAAFNMTVRSGNALDIKNTPLINSNPIQPTSLTVTDGAGVKVEGTQGDLNVQASGTSIVRIGSGLLSAIGGEVNISGAGNGHIKMIVDDSADTQAQQFSILQGILECQVGPTINFNLVQSLNLWEGTGGTTCYIGCVESGTPVSVSATKGSNIYRVPEAMMLQDTLTINDTGNDSTVTIDDSTNPAQHNVTLDDSKGVTTVNGLTPGGLISIADPFQSLMIFGGPGMNVYTVKNTPAKTTISINGKGMNNTLDGPNADATWTIPGQDDGILSSKSLPSPVLFGGFQNLVGGTGNDTFAFTDQGKLDGKVDGSMGVNALDYSACTQDVYVDLPAQKATAINGQVLNIQNATGGHGGAAGSWNILVGNGGNILTGGTGRVNLLIAGAKPSTLTGGDQGDILIGGTTTYDQNLVALDQIIAEWTSNLPYAQRVSNLEMGMVPLNAFTVMDNGGGNHIVGHPGNTKALDLFFGAGANLEASCDWNSQLGEQYLKV